MREKMSRFDNYMKCKGLNDNQVTVECKLSQGLLGQARNGKSDLGNSTINKILNTYQDLNRVWLLTGEGEMLNIHQEDAKPSNVGGNINSFNLYNIEAAANLSSLFINKNENVVGEIMIPNIPKCDGALYVRGDSMEPVLKSGDIVAFKQVQADPRSIVYGEMYIVSFDMNGDDYVAVKIVDRSDNGPEWIRLISYNDYYKPMDVELSRVRAIAMVKLSIRMHTMV